MGERKGQLKYYPPDFDYKTHKSLSGYHGEHSLRERAKRIDEGILIIRFEMPFNMWCGGCRKHIGMGVRYNAEKSKVGKYYSTPIFKFRMRCHLCPNYIEIQTDPQHAAYVVVGGGERREQRWDAADNGQIAPEKWENKKKLALDSMYKLEHTSNDETKGKRFQNNLSMLVNQDSDWKNEHLVSRVFSKHFKELKKKRKQTEELKNKYSLDIDLLSDEEDEEENDEVKKIKTSNQPSSSSLSLSSSKNKVNLKGGSKEMNDLLGNLSKKKVNMGGIMGIIARGGGGKKGIEKESLVFKNSNIKLKKVVPAEGEISNRTSTTEVEISIKSLTTTKTISNKTSNSNGTTKTIIGANETINTANTIESTCSETPKTPTIHNDDEAKKPESPYTQKNEDSFKDINTDNNNNNNSNNINNNSSTNFDNKNDHFNVSNTSALSNLMVSYGTDEDEEDEDCVNNDV